jgi:hypothetical protein
MAGEGIGRTRRKLAAWYNDSFRWSAIPDEKGHPMLESYATMTDCVRYGVEISDGEVFARGR